MTFVVDVCAKLVHIVWISELYRVINVNIRKMASIRFGSYYDASTVCLFDVKLPEDDLK